MANETFAEKVSEIRKDIEKLRSVVSIPLDPEDLNRFIQASSYKLKIEIARFPTYRISFLAPPGRTHIPFPIPSGYLGTRRSPLTFESSYYSPDIKIDTYVDDVKVNPTPLKLTGKTSIDFGEFYIKRQAVDVFVINETEKDAIITMQIQTSILKEEFYEEFYKPLVDSGYEALETLAEALH